MLSKLHNTVEREESKWSEYTATLQQELDEARCQIDLLQQSNRQSCLNNSEDSENGTNVTK